MLELNGKYNSAKIFTNNCETEAQSQIINLLNQPMIKDAKVRIMPDVHAGAGCTIGTTMTLTDKVCPNLVGVDIGCGMLVVKLGSHTIELETLDETIHRYIPSGFSIHDKPHYFTNERNLELEKLYCRDAINIDRAYKSIGTLGSGNHFIELDEDTDGNKYLVIHSGSRHLGLEVANFYQKAAYADLCKKGKADKQAVINTLIASLKTQGRQSDIQSEIAKLTNAFVPEDLAYCEGQLFENYIHDMKIIQHYADINRQAIAEIIMRYTTDVYFNITFNYFTTVHNYIDTDNMILRKGAVSAQKDETLIIPMNMRDGSLICIGKGNSDWNCSAPHGAGRLMSRSKAKQIVSMDEFEKSMTGIYSTSVCTSTLDESPMAYKPMDEIISNIGDTVDVVKTIKPIYNFKASD